VPPNDGFGAPSNGRERSAAGVAGNVLAEREEVLRLAVLAVEIEPEEWKSPAFVNE
jgi:hypothetical protein